MNLAILTGRLARPAEHRSLPSGDPVAYLDVTVEGPDQKHETVNVAVYSPPASTLSLDEGDEVIVVGRVRRRFYRTAARLESRTEVVAEGVARPRQARKAASLVERARLVLDDLDEQTSPRHR